MSVTVKIDQLQNILKNINTMSKKYVAVGVPSETSPRTEPDPVTGKSQFITNAELAYIHNYGSPVKGIPARPFLEPGIEKAQPRITSILKKYTVAAINNPSLIVKGLRSAGSIAEKSIQGIIRTSEGFQPLKPVTLALRKKQTKSGVKGTKPLVRTGALLASIKYVIRDR